MLSTALRGHFLAGLMLGTLLCACSPTKATSPDGESLSDEAYLANETPLGQVDAPHDMPDEAWAARLVDHEAARAGDRDAIVADAYALLATHPDHPLAEGTLVFLNAVEAELERPAEARAALLALDPEAGFDPVARTQLEFLQDRARLRGGEPRPAADVDNADVGYAGFADAALVTGPLGPANDPLAILGDVDFLRRPDLAAQQLVGGHARAWQRLEPGPYVAGLNPGDVLDTSRGWAHLLTGLRSPVAGPAFLELSLAFGRGGGNAPAPASKLFHFGGRALRGWVHGAGTMPPSFAWSLNGEPPQIVDMGAGERSARVLLPVVLRAGLNRLSLRLPSSTAGRLNLRALAPDGSLWPDMAWVLPEPGQQLAEREPFARSVAPPAVEPVDTTTYLLTRPQRGPCADALLGALLLLDHRPALGLAHLKRAAGADRLGPKALLAGLLDSVAHLPPKLRASRAQQLVDEILEVDPDYLPAAVALADRRVAEDREMEAVALLRTLGETHPEQITSQLHLENLLRRLSLVFEADDVLELAAELSPDAPTLLQRQAELAQRRGETRRAFRLSERVQRLQGWTPAGLIQLSQHATSVGELDLAKAYWDAALERNPSRSQRLRHAHWLGALGEHEEALAAMRSLVSWGPRNADAILGMADLHRLAGDESAELGWLRQARDIEPGRPDVRLRLEQAGIEDPVEAGAREWLVDTEAALAAYASDAQSDSVVKLLDQAYVHLFEDGRTETITHDLLQLRDLAGVSDHGERTPPGEILALATVKPDGRRLEPVLVGESYVMPQLEPGDFIEQVTRTANFVPPGFPRRQGGWFFQSTAMPFLRSRYVVSLPRGHELRLVLDRFEGSHRVEQRDDREIHVFEQLDSPRMLREPGAPPNDWILPMVEFGQDADLLAESHRQQVLLRMAGEPTPELEAKARSLVSESEGQQAAAVVLFDFVQGHVEKRRGEVTPAQTTFSLREGNAPILFAALLRVAGIPHDLVWSRDVAPEADDEPEPSFRTVGRLSRRLLVLVQPDDGNAVLCDPSVRLLPYGRLPSGAPGAEAMRVGTGELLRLPRSEGDDMPGQRIQLVYKVHADGSAEVEGVVHMLGEAGFTLKRELRDLPEDYRASVVAQTAAAYVDGIDFADGRIAGLNRAGQRVGFVFSGTVPRFLDRQEAADGATGQVLSRPLPFQPLQMASGLASEGERRLPYRSTGYGRLELSVDLELDPELEFADDLEELQLEFEGLIYGFSVQRSGANSLRLRRRFETRPYVISREAHADLMETAERIDELERGRLRFRVSS